MIYKIISKLMCNRVALVLPDLIHDNQGAFIQGRSIIENVLVCQDIVHMYARNHVSPRCLFKIDLQKAYDTGMVFCGTTAICGQRTLRQGDPISPLIFTIYDLLMFCKEDAPSIILLMKAFTSFSNASGLKMNNTKSEMFFSGMRPELKTDILRVTGFQEARSEDWVPKKLSYAGRITLINSVLNTLHSYWATMFLIPKSVIRRIEAICRNNFWDGRPDYHRVPLVAWDRVTMPKDAGGLGVKKVENWNWAAVGKLVNWVYTKADRLWIRWISNVYLKEQDWQSYSPPADSPWTWKSVCKIKDKLKDGFGENCWLPDENGYTLRNGYK
ncbi:uncharacterized protein LOC141640029 [Silene latifolia]|uniref:uncharacterized protein LOC141640029 n=1 Tax=Silene latifolia TaxID=37657 RepID=UPI003D77B990